jgi:hypothetical protein
MGRTPVGDVKNVVLWEIFGPKREYITAGNTIWQTPQSCIICTIHGIE